MTRGTGGWALELRCECGATDTFRGVVLTLAGERAIQHGWHVEVDQQTLAKAPHDRKELCPGCVALLAG